MTDQLGVDQLTARNILDGHLEGYDELYPNQKS